MDHEWTPEEDDLIRSLWQTTLSTRLIAVQMGRQFNKNMIIGRKNRLQLPSRSSPIINGKVRIARAKPPRRPRAEREISARKASPRPAPFVSVSPDTVMLENIETPREKKVLSPVERERAVVAERLEAIAKNREGIPFADLKDRQCKNIKGKSLDGEDLYHGAPTTSRHDSYCDDCKKTLYAPPRPRQNQKYEQRPARLNF